jgi:hypothetical protein
MSRFWLAGGFLWGAIACEGTPTVNQDPVPTSLAVAVQPSARAQTGVAFATQPVVQVLDENGDPLARAGISVQTTIASGPAAASIGGAGVVTGGDGRAAFADLEIAGGAGAYLLRFESAGLTPDTSGQITLLPVNPMLPLTELPPFTYYGRSGGLYPGGSNAMPSRHDSVGRARARAVIPRDSAGNPDAAGKYVIMSMGMSNTTMEWCSANPYACSSWGFNGQAAADPAVNKVELAIANGAMGGQTATFWDDPADANYARVRDSVLGPRGLGEAQVQVLWLKVAHPNPASGPGNGGMPAAGSDADSLVMHMGAIARAAKIRYPNLQMVFASSRIYAGYATIALNPEPYAYESGFAVKWLIEAQITQMAGGAIDPRAGDLNYDGPAPWIAWGPYLWANGLTPRADGLTWEVSEFASDGTHPAQAAQQKVGTMLLDFFKTSQPAACWFAAGQSCQ